jgi:hypothetical protein
MRRLTPDTLHPKFIEAMEHLETIRSDERLESDESKRWLSQAVIFAPEFLQREFGRKARELGLVPEAKFYNGAGEPVFTAEQVAGHLGLPVAEVQREFAEIAALANG